MTSAAPRRARPHYEGDPTLAKVMRTPKWIGALLLALLVAAGFAWLGQWQLSHAITSEGEHAVETEIVRPMSEATAPGATVTDQVAGTLLQTSGRFVAGDFDVVEQRSNGGQIGAWVVGHLIADDADSGHLAVAIGWAPDVECADLARESFESALSGEQVAIEGRYMPTEGVIRPAADDDPQRLLSMSPAQLVNLWQPFEGRAYAGYLVMHPSESGEVPGFSDAGLDAIDSVPPLPVETINWLNLFYAVEWAVFAGFAVFFWYRLTRDDWEKIHEQKLQTQQGQQGEHGQQSHEALNSHT